MKKKLEYKPLMWFAILWIALLICFIIAICNLNILWSCISFVLIGIATIPCVLRIRNNRAYNKEHNLKTFDSENLGYLWYGLVFTICMIIVFNWDIIYKWLIDESGWIFIAIIVGIILGIFILIKIIKRIIKLIKIPGEIEEINKKLKDMK